MEKNEFKYVWLNINTGEFSNSWSEADNIYLTEAIIDEAKTKNWKLIKYQCLNDDLFELYNLMKIISNKKNKI